MKAFRSKAKLAYYPSWWLIAYADDELCKYYRSLINREHRSIKLNPPRHGAHITIIAGKYEEPANKEPWGRYQDEVIEFQYEPEVKTNGEYFWLTVSCPRFEQIRTELELNPTIPIPWHLTVGNLR